MRLNIQRIIHDCSLKYLFVGCCPQTNFLIRSSDHPFAVSTGFRGPAAGGWRKSEAHPISQSGEVKARAGGGRPHIRCARMSLGRRTGTAKIFEWSRQEHRQRIGGSPVALPAIPWHGRAVLTGPPQAVWRLS